MIFLDLQLFLRPVILIYIDVYLTLLKDRYFTKAFGKELSVKPVPFLSSATYTSRDLLTIYASFNLPPKLAPHIERLGFTYGSAQNIAQLITPISMQIVSTPLPLLGMNYYNSPNATLKERLLFIRKEYFNTVIARMMRIGVAYGFGQILNKSIKKKLNSYFR